MQYIGEMRRLSDETVADAALPQGVQFFGVGLAAKVTGSMHKSTNVKRYGRLRVKMTELHGVADPVAGYLYDTGQTIGFIDGQGNVIFEFSSATTEVELHEKGFIVDGGNGEEYLMGNMGLMPKGAYRARTIHAAGFGGINAVWLKRFVEIGVVDQAYFDKDRRKSIAIVVFSLTFAALVLVAIILFGEPVEM